MNKVIQDELIDDIQELLSRKYPDYIFKELFQDEDVNFPGALRINVFFWDMEKQRELRVCLIVPIMELLTAPGLLIKTSLISRINSELTKLKENKS